MIRAWLEPDVQPELRVRIVAVRPGLPEQRILSSTSVDEACEAVRRWLADLRPGESGKITGGHPG